MSFLESMLTSFILSGIWIAIVSFLAKSLLANFLSKNLEQLKGQIAAQNTEKQIILARLHEKRVDAVALIYQELLKYLQEAKRFVFEAEHVDENKRLALLEAMSNASNAYNSTFLKYHLYLRKSTCKIIKDVFEKANAPSLNFTYTLSAYIHGASMTEEEYMKAWEKTFTIFADEIPPLLIKLDEEFRFLLGVNE